MSTNPEEVVSVGASQLGHKLDKGEWITELKKIKHDCDTSYYV